MLKRSLILLLAIGLLVAGCNVASPTSTPVPGQNQLTVVFLDVGQGDSTLIRSPGGKIMLIDGGQSLDLARQVILPQLRAWGATQVDVLIPSHPDADHISGLVGILESFPVKLAALTGQVHATQTYERLLRNIRDKNLEALRVRTGTQIQFDPAVKLEVLGPDEQFVQSDDTNDASIVLKLTYGNSSFLFTGDAELSESQAILDHRFDVKSTVLKLGHHGSRTSTNEDWLKRAQPEIGIISVGSDNPFGHPHPEVVTALQKLNIPYVRTDEHGTITVTSDGTTLRVTSEH